MGIIERARVLRGTIERLAENLDDEQALENKELFGNWAVDTEYAVGDRRKYLSVLYKCLQAHTSQAAWTPVASPSLWAKVLAGQDGTDIGVWEQPDSTNGYMTGDKVYYPTLEDDIYESLIDNNVWSPAAYPDGWRLVEEETEPETPEEPEEPVEPETPVEPSEPETPVEPEEPEEEVIPVWSQPDASNPYVTGDKVYYPDENGSIYISTIDGNVWSPEAYPSGWLLYEGE